MWTALTVMGTSEYQERGKFPVWKWTAVVEKLHGNTNPKNTEYLNRYLPASLVLECTPSIHPSCMTACSVQGHGESGPQPRKHRTQGRAPWIQCQAITHVLAFFRLWE